MQSISLDAFREEQPGPRWRALYAATWPAYRAWYQQPGNGRRPTAAEAEGALKRYLPE
ncbi:MAG: peptidase C45, partial [Mycobacteriaceae bacterium]|nr:peptidase C45 [Mycobacteriaceae bacterium]